MTLEARLSHDPQVQCSGCRRVIDLPSGERVGFRDTCPGCGRDLHACVQCAHYDPAAYNACRETQAERVGERERANRCDYFRPSEAGEAAAGDELGAARDRLEALFKK